MNPAVYVAVLCLVLGTQATPKLTNDFDLEKGFEGYTSANVNEYADRLLAEIGPALVQVGLDPFHVVDLWGNFTLDVIFEFDGHIELNQGILNGLSTIQRGGDCFVSYDHRLLRLNLVANVEDILGNFLYVAKLGDLGPSGLATVKIRGQKLLIDLIIDLEETRLSLQGLVLEKEESYIDVHLSDSGLADLLLNAVSDAVVGLFRKKLLFTIEEQANTMIHDFLDKLPPLLPPLPFDPDHPLTCLQNVTRLLHG